MFSNTHILSRANQGDLSAQAILRAYTDDRLTLLTKRIVSTLSPGESALLLQDVDYYCQNRMKLFDARKVPAYLNRRLIFETVYPVELRVSC